MYIQFKNDVYVCAPDGTKHIQKKKKNASGEVVETECEN